MAIRFHSDTIKKAAMRPKERELILLRKSDIQSAAKEKGLIELSPWELSSEKRHAEQFFELGCWLYFYSKRVSKEGRAGFNFRVDCLKKIIRSGVKEIGYNFHTVFDFGEREYDTIFEMGDVEQIKRAIIAEIPNDESGKFKQFCLNIGWLKN